MAVSVHSTKRTPINLDGFGSGTCVPNGIFIVAFLGSKTELLEYFISNFGCFCFNNMNEEKKLPKCEITCQNIKHEKTNQTKTMNSTCHNKWRSVWCFCVHKISIRRCHAVLIENQNTRIVLHSNVL